MRRARLDRTGRIVHSVSPQRHPGYGWDTACGLWSAREQGLSLTYAYEVDCMACIAASEASPTETTNPHGEVWP